MVRRTTWFYLTLSMLPLLQAATPPVVVSPGAPSVRGGATRQFAAQLTGVSGPVTWSVNGATNGNPTVGTIDATGLYTAPMVNPKVTLKVRAALTATPATFGEATVTWLNPEPSIQSLQPPAVNIGTFTVTINGKGFVTGSQIKLDGKSQTTKFVSSTQLSFQTTVSSPDTIAITVTNPDPGGATSGARTLTVMPPTKVTVSPDKTNVRLGTAHKFNALIDNAVDKTVHWSVNGILGGNPSVGTIATDGTYTPPAVLPATNAIEIEATSVPAPMASGKSAVTLLNPKPVIQAVGPQPLTYSSPSIAITGTGFVLGSTIKIDGSALITTFVSPTQLTAMTTLAPTPGGLLAFTVSNPNPGAATSSPAIVPVGTANPKVSYLAAARFLEQASWGPDAASIAHLQQIGFDAWITEQLAAPPTTYRPSSSSSNSLVDMQSAFFVNGMKGPDQLRQRVAFALSQIFVVSGLKTGAPRQMIPYQNMLINDAFSSYATVLRDVTLSPTMGVYLDMVNNDKGNAADGTAPNENYGREVMQLFSLGTAKLNPDGSTQTNASGPIPTYDQTTITNMAHALTGWTFPGRVITSGHNPENYNAPMIAVEANHDTSAKVIIGGVKLAAGQTAGQDLAAVLQALSTHPNVAPFISLRLIEHLVTSNPSPQYLTRISNTFTSTNGDLSAVVRAILLDPEARQGDDPNAIPQSNGGHLREPVLFLLAMMRALNATVANSNPIESLGADMGQEVYYPASVFNYYSPLFRTSTGLLAPEFQLLTSSSALVRANAVQDLVARGLDGDAHIAFAPFTALASSPADLVTAVDNAFLYGRLPASLKADIVTAISASDNSLTRVQNAIYLVCTSSLYQVEH